MNNNQNIPHILVIGAGAVGVFFSSKTAFANNAKVSVLARSDRQILEKQNNVYHLETVAGNYDFSPENVYSSLDDLDFEPDFLFVALKADPALDQAAYCAKAISPKTVIVIIENGIGNEEPFVKNFPENDIIGVAAYVGASRPVPGTVKQVDGGKLIAGCANGNQSCVSKLEELFKGTDIVFEKTDSITAKRWEKLLWNVPFNTIAILGRSADTSIIMNDEYAVNLAREVMKEVCEIALAEGYKIPNEKIDGMINYTKQFAAYKPSTLQDFENNKKIELDAILGAPLRIADKHNLSIPHMRTLYALLRLAARQNGF